MWSFDLNYIKQLLQNVEALCCYQIKCADHTPHSPYHRAGLPPTAPLPSQDVRFSAVGILILHNLTDNKYFCHCNITRKISSRFLACFSCFLTLYLGAGAYAWFPLVPWALYDTAFRGSCSGVGCSSVQMQQSSVPKINSGPSHKSKPRTIAQPFIANWQLQFDTSKIIKSAFYLQRKPNKIQLKKWCSLEIGQKIDGELI